MPGLTDWWDVFRCGTHIDHSGVQRTISAVDIDRAIAAYEPGSAPLVVGHPKLNAPAYGWVAEFRRLGDLVQAKASQVAPEFAEAVKAGRWKKRSIAFGPDMTFRHVGFLGAAAPAVKGLRDIVFADKEAFMEIETAADAAPQDVTNQETAPQEAAAPAAAAAEAAAVKAEAGDGDQVDEQEKNDLKKELKDVKSQLLKVIKAYEAERAKNRRAEFAAYVGGLVTEGRLRGEAQNKVIEFMDALQTSAGDGAEFAEGDSDNLKRFKTLLNEILTPRVEFAEVATQAALAPAAGSGSAENIAREIRSLRAKLAAEGVTVNASQAMAQILGGKHDE